MRIGLFTDGYEPQTSGMIVSIKMLKEELTKLGHDVYIITCAQYDSFRDDVVRFKGYRVPFKALKDYHLRRYKRKDLKRIKALHLDIIHIHSEFSMGIMGLKASKKLGIPAVYTSHTMFFDYKHFIPAFLRPIGNLVLRSRFRLFHYKTAKTVYPTKKVLHAYKNLITKPFSYEIIPTGVHLDNFMDRWTSADCLKLRDKLNIKHDEKVLLSLGRISQEKSIDLVINAFSNVDNFDKLVIAGDGPHEQKLRELVANLAIEDKVIFPGNIKWSEVGLYYAMADLFVNASITETQGLTYIEALASSLPVICRYDTNLDDVIIDNVNGRFFKDTDELTTILNNIEAKEINLLASNTKEVALKYSSATYAKNILAVYSEVLNKNH